MSWLFEGTVRSQVSLFPERLEGWICEHNPVPIVEVLVDALDLADLGCDRMAPANRGRLECHPSVLLKILIYGYLNRIPSSLDMFRRCRILPKAKATGITVLKADFFSLSAEWPLHGIGE